MEADRAYREGANILILSDRGVDEYHVPIPSLLAVSALQQHLVKTKKRTAVAMILESGEPREVHHFATLSWQAKEDGNTEKALAYFNNTYGAFMEYDKALKHLQQRMKELGYNTDTQIAAFGGR